MKGGLQLLRQRQARPPDARQQLTGDLNRARRPPTLLALKRRDRSGQLRRTRKVQTIVQRPTRQLGPIGQVQILGQGIAAPAAHLGILDGRLPPHPACAVEVHHQTVPGASALLDGKMTVDPQGLRLGQPGFFAVEVAPPALEARQIGLRFQKGDGFLEKVHWWNEIGVEYSHIFPARRLQAVGQRSRLVALPTDATNDPDVHAFGGQPLRHLIHNVARAVVAVVQHLNFVFAGRVLHGGDRLNDSLYYAALVVDGDLRRHDRPVVRRLVSVIGLDDLVLTSPPPCNTATEEIEQDVQVQAVYRQSECRQQEYGEYEPEHDRMHVGSVRFY